MNKKFLSLLKLHLLVIVYSLSTVFSKFASQQEFLSLKFFVFICLLFFCLAVYAFFWQKVLSNFNLSVAYANRAADLLWGIILGAIFFAEKVTFTKVISVALVFFGIILVIRSEKSKIEN